MKRKHYNSLEEWQLDLDKMHAHPDDTRLMASVVRCIENSSDKVQQEIKDYLSNSALENNPWVVFNQISKENPEHMLFVKSRKDPWFIA